MLARLTLLVVLLASACGRDSMAKHGPIHGAWVGDWVSIHTPGSGQLQLDAYQNVLNSYVEATIVVEDMAHPAQLEELSLGGFFHETAQPPFIVFFDGYVAFDLELIDGYLVGSYAIFDAVGLATDWGSLLLVRR
ncbi:MAG: hypothetical protein ACYSW8_32770 [Planctomycetota bacterium]|jgi:hypothetical protein